MRTYLFVLGTITKVKSFFIEVARLIFNRLTNMNFIKKNTNFQTFSSVRLIYKLDKRIEQSLTWLFI